MKKILVAFVAVFIALSALTGCTAKVYKNNYNYVFSRDLMVMDYVYTYRNTDHVHNANFVDGLQENDQYGNFVGALATKVEHNEDYTVWTYTLRKGVNWVTSTGEVYDTVKADDFVAGLQHASDFQSLMLYIVSSSIKGLADYVDGTTTDFSTVGVKAIDEYTLQYTLNSSEPWFNTKTTYSILYPINREFLESKGVGCKLGAPDKATCDFGKPVPESILYNGGYILAEFTSKSVIRYTANPNYWDKAHVYIPEVKLVYFDGSDPTSLLTGFEKGDFSQARIYTANYASTKAKYPDNLFATLTGSTTYNMTFNLAREAKAFSWKNLTNLGTQEAVDKAFADTAKAMLNKNFRLALQYAMDRVGYLATAKGNAEIAKIALRNMLTPPEFVLANGKEYGTLVEEALAVLDPTNFADIDLSNGQDPFNDAVKAKAFLALAVTELGDSVSWPIHLDLPEDGTSAVGVAGGMSLKESIETALGADKVVVDVGLWTTDEYDAIAYGATMGSESDWDISTASGWGPDYLDPKTWLDIYDPTDGDMLTTLGLNPLASQTDAMKAAIIAVGLDDYKALIDAADAEKTDIAKRYELYAKADAWLVANAIQIPTQADGGNPILSKVVPFTAPFALTGIAMNKFKFMQVQDEIVTIAQRQKALDAWTAKRSK